MCLKDTQRPLVVGHYFVEFALTGMFYVMLFYSLVNKNLAAVAILNPCHSVHVFILIVRTKVDESFGQV